jgi:hypothetical protein
VGVVLINLRAEKILAPQSECEHATHSLAAQEKSVLFSATHLIAGALSGSEKLCSGAQN